MMSDMIVSGVVGEECLTHSDCVTENAECVGGEDSCPAVLSSARRIQPHAPHLHVREEEHVRSMMEHSPATAHREGWASSVRK